MADVLWNADREACAREAAEAIEAVLDRRCPGIRVAFWSAVEKHYRLDTAPKGARPVAQAQGFDDPPPIRSRWESP